MKNLQVTLLFHLNLSYSSIDEDQHQELVERCYWPMLALVDKLPWLVFAVEATGHTLERLAHLDPDWVARLRELQAAGRIEFVGSGDTQLIGPLVPSLVNRWNQRLGQEVYGRYLDRLPKTALVNEMAWSQGLVDHYLDAAYELVLMEWNNPRRSHPEWDDEWRYRLAWTSSPQGKRIALAWIDAVAFQKFQRAVMGELEPDAYLDWLLGIASEEPRHLFLYANDAEIFDFRPQRYATEPDLAAGGEWTRMADLLTRVHEAGVLFTTPESLRIEDAFRPGPTLVLNGAADPIPVKKQPKYNVTRWALTGRDDVGLNARCFARAELLRDMTEGQQAWRSLCRAWASDLRTHLTKRRWQELRAEWALESGPQPVQSDMPGADLETARVEYERDLLVVETDDTLVAFNLRRGLAVDSLGFQSKSPYSLLGTLPHGYFEDIDWAADFYSGHTVVEVPGRPRIADLDRVDPRVERMSDRIRIEAVVKTALGPLAKRIEVFADRIDFFYGFSRWGERPACSLRTGTITLNPESFGPNLVIGCANGGAPERFVLRTPCDHGRSVSPVISSAAAFGATDGQLTVDDGRVGLQLAWKPWETAALPLLTYQTLGDKRFVRLAFSLSEIDETHRGGAPLYDFELSLSAYSKEP